MQRKRGGLVPIDEVIADLPGPIQESFPVPQVVHHFTLADQIGLLVSASEADADLGFMGRMMALCSLPRTNPGNRKEYVRQNGPYALGMTAGVRNKLPYGAPPRLILSWLCTEAVRTGSREIVLGKSLSDFMTKLGITCTNGRTQARLRNQMKRLFGCSVSMIYEDKHSEARVSSFVADRAVFWWDPKQPDQAGRWESKIRLGEDFFNEIISHPVPLNMNTLKAIKRSPLGLDLYLWLTYRVFALRGAQPITWRQMYRQFGVDPDNAGDNVTVQNFRRKVLRELKKIKLAWPELNYSTGRGVLILHPSTPTIRPAPESLRIAE